MQQYTIAGQRRTSPLESREIGRSIGRRLAPDLDKRPQQLCSAHIRTDLRNLRLSVCGVMGTAALLEQKNQPLELRALFVPILDKRAASAACSSNVVCFAKAAHWYILLTGFSNHHFSIINVQRLPWSLQTAL